MATIQQYEYFLELSKHTTMTAAANALHISISNMSMAISALEKELDSSLIIRKRNHITLTQEGRDLLQIVDTFFTALNLWKAQKSLPKTTFFSSENIHLYTSVGPNNDIFQYIIPELYKFFPDTAVSTFIYSATELSHLLLTKKCDVVFTYQVFDKTISNSFDHWPSSLTFHPLFECEMLNHVPYNFIELIEEDIQYIEIS